MWYLELSPKAWEKSNEDEENPKKIIIIKATKVNKIFPKKQKKTKVNKSIIHFGSKINPFN